MEEQMTEHMGADVTAQMRAGMGMSYEEMGEYMASHQNGSMMGSSGMMGSNGMTGSGGMTDNGIMSNQNQGYSVACRVCDAKSIPS